MPRLPYPLQWPDGYPRTEPRKRQASRFSSGMLAAGQAVHQHLKLVRARQVVITSDVPHRQDGLPYASAREPEDVGVAVWWIGEDAVEHVLACDRWRLVRDNLHAIALTLDAVRGINRWGASDILRRVFAGFTALPPGTEPSPPSPASAILWRETLGVPNIPNLSPEDTIDLAKAHHRRLIKTHHPDAGGNVAVAADLNAALEAALRWYEEQ